MRTANWKKSAWDFGPPADHGRADAWQLLITFRIGIASHNVSHGVPLPPGWDWVARPLEFIAPNSLFRLNPQGAPVRIPAIADAEKQKKNSKKGLGATIVMMGSRETSETPLDRRPLR